MSSKVSRKESKNSNSMFELELSYTVISFRELLSYIGVEDIYSGREVIPFREKDEEFQKLLLSEFKS